MKFAGLDVAGILALTVDDALTFFRAHADQHKAVKHIIEKILPLQETGLGYVQLGQSSSTLSGGEAQRVKLASFLVKGQETKPTLFIFDEPTTGLHFHDIAKLLKALNALVDNGHSVLVIEHNTEVVRRADHLIDLGPEAGDGGGELVFAGPPEDMVAKGLGHTAESLRGKG